VAKSRKRSWLPEEVILALEIYIEHGTYAPTAVVTDLSERLRAWPLERRLAADPSFRNVGSVRSKLQNIRHFDVGGGRPNAGRATERVWQEYGLDAARVQAQAERIRALLDGAPAQEDPMDDEDEEFAAEEGWLIRRVHLARERNETVVRQKKNAFRTQHNRLMCEACGCDPATRYNDPAADSIIECHHKVPLSELQPGTATTQASLTLVCPNCHRLAHARRPSLTWEELVALVNAAPAPA
jgi:5-methylcytosine-specific restriction protein A